MGKRAPIYRAGGASACSLALLDGQFHEEWTCVVLGANLFLLKKGGKKRERKRESSSVLVLVNIVVFDCFSP
jgi:hypothetical protein